MLVKSLQDYDASVYTRGAIIYDSQGIYYLCVSTTDLINYSTFNADKGGYDIIIGHWSDEFDYIIYKSTDNYIYEKCDSGHANKVTVAFTKGKVNFDAFWADELEVEEEYVETPEATLPPNITVTVGDEVIETLTEIQIVNNEMVEAQHILNGLLSTVLFFFIFVWAEKRIKHAVRSFTGRGLDE